MSGQPVIWIVQGDSAKCDALVALLETFPVEVSPCATGAEFLQAYDPNRPGCVLLALELPDGGCRELLENRDTSGLSHPVIAIGERAAVRTVVAVMRAGAFDYLESSCQGPELQNRIRQALDHDAEQRQQRSGVSAVDQILQSLLPESAWCSS